MKKLFVTDIISEVKKSRVSILADEVRECSNTEQMSFVIRYVDKSCQIREEFIKILECESGSSGQELYLKIVHVFRNLGLEISNLRVIWQRKKWCIIQNFKTE